MPPVSGQINVEEMWQWLTSGVCDHPRNRQVTLIWHWTRIIDSMIIRGHLEEKVPWTCLTSSSQLLECVIITAWIQGHELCKDLPEKGLTSIEENWLLSGSETRLNSISKITSRRWLTLNLHFTITSLDRYALSASSLQTSINVHALRPGLGTFLQDLE